MSKLGFLSNLGSIKLNQLGDALTTALVNFDPESASEADIKSMGDHVQELSQRVVHAQTQAAADKTRVANLKSSIDRSTQAATVLGDRIENATDPTVKAASSANLTTLLDSIEKQTGELNDAQKNAAESEADVAEWTSVHAEATKKWTEARGRLEQARRDLAHAKDEQQRAEERAAAAKFDAGLKAGLNAGAVGLSAMEQSAQKAREAAAAAKLTTDALKASTGGGVEDIVADALKASEPSVSPLDRLAALKKASHG